MIYLFHVMIQGWKTIQSANNKGTDFHICKKSDFFMTSFLYTFDLYIRLREEEVQPVCHHRSLQDPIRAVHLMKGKPVRLVDMKGKPVRLVEFYVVYIQIIIIYV